MNTSAVSPGRAGLLLLLSGQMLPLIDTSITNVALDAITHTWRPAPRSWSLSSRCTASPLPSAWRWAVSLAITMAAGACLCGASPSLASLPCCADGEQHRRPAGGPHPAGRRGGADCAADPSRPCTSPSKAPPTPGPSACMAGSAGSPLSSVRWAAAGWCRRTSPGWAGATPFINVPICLLVLALSRRYVPETRRETPSRIDWQGTLYLALIPLLPAVPDGPRSGAALAAVAAADAGGGPAAAVRHASERPAPAAAWRPSLCCRRVCCS